MYLTAAAARTRLTSLGQYPDMTEEALADLLPMLEDAIDSWLGWRAALTVYQETAQADRSGFVTLTNSPVERIDAVTTTQPSVPVANQVAPLWQPMNYLWVPPENKLKVFQSRISVRVTYVAGYNPLPRVFANTMFQLLSTALKKTGLSGDLSFLNEPVRDVASLSLPGGLSKTFFKGGQTGSLAGGKDSASETQLDRLLASLKQYRRHYVLTTGICKRFDVIDPGVASNLELGDGEGMLSL